MESEKNIRLLKLIWDFKGPDAARTAEHHAIHLKEFAGKNGLSAELSGIEAVSQMHSIAFLIVQEKDMPAVRDALKPHRGQLYKE